MATIRSQEATAQIRSWLLSRGKSDNTIKAYVTDIQMFYIEMEHDEVEIDNLEAEVVIWMNRYRRRVAPKTLARRITSMRALGRCLGISMLAEYSAPTPARSMPHPLPGLDRDIERLLAAAGSNKQRTLIALCALVGCRVTEAREVSPKDFDLTEMTLTIRGKGDKTRVVPISKAAWFVMAECVTEAMLRNYTTVINFTDRHARELITLLGRKAGVSRPISSHDLRATFGTLAYARTKNIRVVQELLGHATVEQTQLYTGVSQAQMREAANFDIGFSHV